MRFPTSLALLLTMVFAGCATNGESKSRTANLSTLTKNELQQLLINHTFPLSKGGMFFSTESAATVNWDGQTEETTWYATDDSRICYTVVLFGGKEECLSLKRAPSGNYYREIDGKIIEVNASAIKRGRTF